MRVLSSLGLYTCIELLEGLSDAESSGFDFQFKYHLAILPKNWNGFFMIHRVEMANNI